MSMRMLGEVFRQVPDPWWLIDLNTSRFLDANQASVEQLGFSFDEIRRIGVIDVNQAIPSPDAWRAITHGIPHGKTVRFLSELKCKRGDLIPVEVTFARVHAGDGEALLAFTRDLSQIVALEEQLKEQQRLLRKLSAQVPGVLYQLHGKADGSMTFPYTSDATRAVFGFEPSRDGHANELSAVLLQMHAEDREAFLHALEASRRTLAPLHREFRIVRGDESVQWLETRAVPERTADGSTLWHGFTAVVTDRKLAELDLRRRKDLWEMAANAAGLGIVQFNDDAATLSLDSRASRIHGLRDPAIDISIVEWLASVHPEDRVDLASGVLNVACEREGLQARYRVNPDNGVQPVLELHARKFVHETTRAVEVVGTCRDVTEQVGAETLRREKEAAERANRAKSEFLSRVSHELRTPLNGILGFAQLMQLDRLSPLPAPHRERLETLQAAGQRLLSLINDMLDLARIEREDFTLDCSAIDALAVIRASVAVIQPLAGSRSVMLPRDLQRTWVLGHARALEQVLTNLLSNAVKYNAPDGSVRVAVHQDASRVHIAVSDDGPGMTTQQQARLFRPFERLGAEKGMVQGTGLGLVIARELVLAMGGGLLVRSDLGAGTTFTVALPLAERPALTPSAPADGEPAEYSAGLPAQRRVLYIEDEAVNVLLMQEVFRLCPHWTLSVACDGAEGLRRVAEERPDLVLVDMHLPDMDGLQIIDCLRKSEATRGQLCIALSADALCEQVDAARRAGFDDYWTKPIDVTRVMGDLYRALAERPAA